MHNSAGIMHKIVVLRVKQILFDFALFRNISISGQPSKFRVRVGSGQGTPQNFGSGTGQVFWSLYFGSGQFRVG